MKKTSILLGLFFLYCISDAMAVDRYECELTGQYTMTSGEQEGESFEVEAELIEASVGQTTTIQDSYWSITLREIRDGDESLLELRVNTPYRHILLNSTTELGSKFIGASTSFENGASRSSSIQANCRRKGE